MKEKDIDSNLKGFDVIIICASTKNQANFWNERLKSSELIEKKTRVYSIFEDWDGGAGQLLGTLNAWNEVSKLTDLDELIEKNCSIAIYHTAGKGTRIAPLSLAEIDKGAVRLSRLVEYSGTKEPITLLEAVIDQTAIFAKTRKKGFVCSGAMGSLFHQMTFFVKEDITSNYLE